MVKNTLNLTAMRALLAVVKLQDSVVLHVSYFLFYETFVNICGKLWLWFTVQFVLYLRLL